MSYQGRSGRLDDLIGQGFQVMGWNVDPLSLMDDDQVSFLSEIGARAVPASATYKPGRDVVNDLRGVYARWFEQNKVQAVVVRPDYYVFGGVSDAAQLPLLIDDLLRAVRRQAEAERGGVHAGDRDDGDAETDNRGRLTAGGAQQNRPRS